MVIRSHAPTYKVEKNVLIKKKDILATKLILMHMKLDFQFKSHKTKNLTKWKFLVYTSKPQKNFFETLTPPQNTQIGPKNKWKSNVRIERNKENESCSTTWVDPKTVVKPYPDPKNSPLWPKKVKNYPKIK